MMRSFRLNYMVYIIVQISPKIGFNFGTVPYTGSHHCELSANIQNMTLNVTIDNTLVKTFNNVQFYPQFIKFQSIYNGYEGISYNFKIDNLKIYRE